MATYTTREINDQKKIVEKRKKNAFDLIEDGKQYLAAGAFAVARVRMADALNWIKQAEDADAQLKLMQTK